MQAQKHLSRFAVVALIAGLGATPTQAGQTIVGAGSTFAYPILAKWAQAYQTKAGVNMNYQSIGSGGGIKQITANTVDFGASDAPLTTEKLNAAGLIQFPFIMGGVVPVVNLPGIKAGELRLTGSVLADIYLGNIVSWDDPALQQLNPSLRLPKEKITAVARADGSGTTFIFTHYLSKVSPVFKDKIGNNTSVSWPVGVGGKGNEGVASYVQRLKGAIGYVEYAYALQNKMSYAQMQNKAGKFVKPNSKSFQTAAATADWAKTAGFNLMLTDQPGDGSWPITGATFALMHKKQVKADVGRASLTFFDWAYRHGGKMAEELHYVPMPANVVQLVEATWKTSITSAGGAPLWTNASARK